MRTLLQAACWLALGLGSVSLILVALVFVGYRFTGVSVPLYGVLAGTLLLVGILGLRVLTRPKNDATGPRLFLSDLITIMVVLGIYFSALWDLSEEYGVEKFLVSGAAGLLLSLILALLRASRAGLLRGWRRALYSVGCMLATNGLGLVSIFVFVVVSSGNSNRWLAFIQSTPEGRLFLIATEFAVVGIVLGGLLCVFLKPRERPPLDPAKVTP